MSICLWDMTKPLNMNHILLYFPTYLDYKTICLPGLLQTRTFLLLSEVLPYCPPTSDSFALVINCSNIVLNKVTVPENMLFFSLCHEQQAIIGTVVERCTKTPDFYKSNLTCDRLYSLSLPLILQHNLLFSVHFIFLIKLNECLIPFCQWNTNKQDKQYSTKQWYLIAYCYTLFIVCLNNNKGKTVVSEVNVSQFVQSAEWVHVKNRNTSFPLY